MVKNGIDFNSRRESSRIPAEEGEYDHIPVREYNGFKRRRRFVSVEVEKRTRHDRSNDPLTLGREYEARRWYETKAVRDLVQTISFYNDDDDNDGDNEWRQSCPPESDSVEKEHQGDYDEEIDTNWEDTSEKPDDLRRKRRSNDVNTNDEVVREPCLFSFEYFKRKWQKFRDLIDYCYPALSRKKEYYKCPFPCCPSRNPRSKVMPEGDHDDEDQPADPVEPFEFFSTSPPSADQIGPPVSTPSPEDPKVKSEKLIESFDGEVRPEERRMNSLDPVDELFDDPVDESKQQIVKSCCEDDDFWTTLLQILILAPLLAFTAYLFVQWYKTRQEYRKTLRKLNKLKRENDNLVGAIDRLDAFVMSCQMSPIVCVKRQCMLEDQVRRICQSLKNHKEKIKELEQDRAIYREVLWNLKTCA